MVVGVSSGGDHSYFIYLFFSARLRYALQGVLE